MKEIPPVEEGFPMRRWSIQITLLDATGKEVPANIFDKVTYHLHPTFENPVRSIKKAPFRIEEQGWGEFDIGITLTLLEKLGDRKVSHDLNFLSEKYVNDHEISIPLTKPKLNKVLAESGPVDDSLSLKRKNDQSYIATGAAAKNKKSKTAAVKGNVDLEKLAEGLTHLNEDDLLGVVQMVTDNRTPEMNIKNNADEGEFTMDLYTLPDALLRSLDEYVKKRI